MNPTMSLMLFVFSYVYVGRYAYTYHMNFKRYVQSAIICLRTRSIPLTWCKIQESIRLPQSKTKYCNVHYYIFFNSPWIHIHTNIIVLFLNVITIFHSIFYSFPEPVNIGDYTLDETFHANMILSNGKFLSIFIFVLTI